MICNSCDNDICLCRGCDGTGNEKCGGCCKGCKETIAEKSSCFMKNDKAENVNEKCGGCEKKYTCACAYCFACTEDDYCVSYKERKNNV